jgi:FkbM family methyltransferase
MKSVQTRFGTMRCIPGDSIVSESLDRYGEWAGNELKFLQTVVRAGATVLDIGAFIGTHTLAFASMVGPQGRVHAFEPRAAFRELLETNVRANGLDQVRVHTCALGAASGTIWLSAVDLTVAGNFGGLALQGKPAADQDAAGLEPIDVRSLDAFDLGAVDLIKIDTEGMEDAVLRGAAAMLARYRPLLFLECNSLAQGIRTLAELRALGYEVHGVLAEAFNADNFRGAGENIFGVAAELSLFAAPAGWTLPEIHIPGVRVAPVTDADSLALFLLHKPQYLGEVVKHVPAAAVLGLDFASPLARRYQDEREREAANLSTRLAELTVQVERQAALGARMARLEAERDWLSRFRRTSPLYWWERLILRRTAP